LANVRVDSHRNRRRLEKSGVPAGTNGDESFDTVAGTVIVSVVENRAREICISKVDTTNGSVIEIYLMTDSHSYNEALSTLSNLNPDEILLHDGCKNRILSRKIEDHLAEKTRVLFISRQYFDQDRGADMLKRVIVGDIDADLIARYTVLAGTYCLLRYLENCEGNAFGRHSLRVEYCTSSVGRMSIDRRTAINLELISNLRSGGQKESLFGAINYTKTVVGARLLRANILRPSTDIATLEMRLDVVELFLSNNRCFTEVVKLLKQLPDLDKMLTGLSLTFKIATVKTARACIDTLIFLKQTLQIAPLLAEALMGLLDHSGSVGRKTDGVDNSGINKLVKVLSDNLRADCFASLQGAISDIFTDSTVYFKSPLEVLRNLLTAHLFIL
jgi:DNA mismatch repair protein MSH4